MSNTEINLGDAPDSKPPGTLSVGKYTLETSSEATHIYALDDIGTKSWIASTLDPEMGMKIVEGLILVEIKRFYHPDSTPTLKMEGAEEAKKEPGPEVPFLNLKGSNK